MRLHRSAKSFAIVSLAMTLAWTADLGYAAAELTVTLNPSADAMVSFDNGNNNYGGAGNLSVTASGGLQSLLKFDTSSAKANFNATFGAGNWQVQGISLKLTAAAPNPNTWPFNKTPAAGQFSASWMQNDTWVEGAGTPNVPTTTGITYNDLSSYLGPGDQSLGGPFNYDGSTTGTATYSLTPASGLLDDVAAGTLVSLRLLAADSVINYVPNSRNNPTAAKWPVLSITVVPEPSSLVVLLAGGLLGLLAYAWRRRRS